MTAEVYACHVSPKRGLLVAYDGLPVVLQTVFATKLTQYKPLTVDSPQYYENLNITDSQGAINSTARRQYDTNTSLFWADLDGMPLGHAACSQQPVQLAFLWAYISVTTYTSVLQLWPQWSLLLMVQAPRQSMGTTSPSPRACCPATHPC